MNSRLGTDGPSRFEFVKYIGPAIVLFVIIVAFGPQLTEYGMKLIELDSDDETETDSDTESDSSADESLTREIKRKTKRKA